jgi:amidase
VLPTTPRIALRKDAQPSEFADFYPRALTLTSIAGHTGLPQISIPAGEVAGCPVGLSIVGSGDHDRALLDTESAWAKFAGTNKQT